MARVVIGLPRPAPAFTPTFVAVDRGFLADEGIDATIEYGRASEDDTASRGDFVLGPIGRGGFYEPNGLVMVCGHAIRVEPHVLMARPGVERADQLRLVVMTDAEGGGLDKELRTIMAHHGVDFDQADIGITRAPGGHPEQYKLLRAGVGDAAPVGPPWWIFLSQEGYANLGSEAEYTPGLSCIGIHVSREKLARDPAQVSAFVRALVRSMQYCRENQPGTLETMMRYSANWGVTNLDIARQVYDVSSPYWSPQVDLTVIERLLKRTEEQKGSAPQAESFLDLRFLTEALGTESSRPLAS